MTYFARIHHGSVASNHPQQGQSENLPTKRSARQAARQKRRAMGRTFLALATKELTGRRVRVSCVRSWQSWRQSSRQRTPTGHCYAQHAASACREANTSRRQSIDSRCLYSPILTFSSRSAVSLPRYQCFKPIDAAPSDAVSTRRSLMPISALLDAGARPNDSKRLNTL